MQLPYIIEMKDALVVWDKSFIEVEDPPPLSNDMFGEPW